MDNHAQDFARQIITKLDAIRKLIVEALAAQNKKAKSSATQAKETNNNQDKPDSLGKGSSPESNPSPPANDPPAHTQKGRFPRLKEYTPLIELIGAVFIVIYTFVTIGLWCESHNANKIAFNAMMAAQRPWVGVDDETPLRTTPLTFDYNVTASLNIAINAKNFGSYGAQQVFPFAHLVILQDISDFPEREKGLCTEFVSPRLGFVLFPAARTRATTMFASIAPSSQWIRHKGSGSQFYAWIIGCVAYSDQFGNRHHTVTEFRLGHAGTIEMITFEPKPNTIVSGDWVVIHSYFID